MKRQEQQLLITIFVFAMVMLSTYLLKSQARFPKTFDKCDVVWPWLSAWNEPIAFNVTLYSKAGKTVIGTEYKKPGALSEVRQSINLFSDTSWVMVTALDSVGNESQPSNIVYIYRIDTVVVTPPPVEPPPTKFDTPFVDTQFGSWKANGAMGMYDRSYDFGVGLYCFEYVSPGEQYNCWMTGNLALPKGSIDIIVECVTGGDKDSLDISIGTMRKRVKVTKGKPYTTIGYPSKAVFNVSIAATFQVKIDPRAAICIKKISVLQSGVPVDTTPPVSPEIHVENPTK